MQKHELSELDVRLKQIADAIGSRPVGAAGLMVWLDVLSGERFDDVLAVLTDWCKKNSRMPMPADIAKSCQERVSRRVEAQADENRRNSIGLEEALGKAATNSTADPKVVRRELDNIWQVLHGRKGGMIAGHFQHIGGLGQDDDHKEWAKVLRVKEESGEPLSIVQKSAWREALGVKGEEKQH